MLRWHAGQPGAVPFASLVCAAQWDSPTGKGARTEDARYREHWRHVDGRRCRCYLAPPGLAIVGRGPFPRALPRA